MRLRTVLLSLLLLLAVCTPLRVRAQADPQVTFDLAERDPPSGRMLGDDQALYLRIVYESSVPVRFRAQAYRGGELIETGARYNPAPVYPAGQGEGLAWIAFSEAVTIEEIRITASDDRWRDIATSTYPVHATWVGAPRAWREPAPWARRLSDEQQARASDAMAGSSNVVSGAVLFALMVLSIPGYMFLQGYTLLQFRGGWRLAAMVPLVVTIPLAVFTLLGLAAGSNLWPLGALFLTPLAFGYLIALRALRSVRSGNAQSL